MSSPLKAIIFDFGGVLAEEGFRSGLLAIGVKRRLDLAAFWKTANELIHETGYVTGKAEEAAYWNELRRATGIAGSDDELRHEILKRFVLRPEMLSIVACIRAHGLILAILSDQTNWLDEIDSATPFSRHFHYVFNSARIGKSKRDRSVFADVSAAMGIKPAEAVFIDDDAGNVARAQEAGMQAICFRDLESFKSELKHFVRCPEEAAV